MGGFEGHLFPGLSLFLYGLYHAALLSRAVICNSPVQYPPRRPRSKGRWARLQQTYYIGFLKILSSCILVAQELNSINWQLILITKRHHLRSFMYRKQWQHLTLYVSFFLSGCADVVSQNLLPKRCVVLEQGAQALSMYLFLPLMVSHMQDTEGVELQTHMLLIQAMFLLTLVGTVELWAPNVLLIWMLKAFLYILSGSWLMQIGFMLYKPISGYKWLDDDENDIAFATTFFCWHVAFGAFLMISAYGFSILWYRYLSAGHAQVVSYCLHAPRTSGCQVMRRELVKRIRHPSEVLHLEAANCGGMGFPSLPSGFLPSNLLKDVEER